MMAEPKPKTDLHALAAWLRNRKLEADRAQRPSLAVRREREVHIWDGGHRIDLRSPAGSIVILRHKPEEGFLFCCFEGGPFQVYYHFKTVNGAGLAVFDLLAAGETPRAEPEPGYA